LQPSTELLCVGQVLQTLPRIRAAFAAAQPSFDSVRELSRVPNTSPKVEPDCHRPPPPDLSSCKRLIDFDRGKR
jgi:hypothetical protein